MVSIVGNHTAEVSLPLSLMQKVLLVLKSTQHISKIYLNGKYICNKSDQTVPEFVPSLSFRVLQFQLTRPGQTII